MAELVTLDQVLAHLNIENSSPDVPELEMFIAAVSEHVASNYGEMPSGTYTEEVAAFYQAGTIRLAVSHQPVLTVASITDSDDTTYTTDFTITPAGYIAHDDLAIGTWTVVYTAGYSSVPDDLQLAALEDIRGLYQPGQIGAPAQFGAFGIESTDVGTTYRPVRAWPRVDAWIERRTLPGIA